MSFNQDHKRIVKETIGYLFDNLSEDAEQLELQINQLSTAVKTRALNPNYAPLTHMFEDPARIGGLDQCGALTVGEARKGMLDYMNERIVEAAKKTGISPRYFGWKYEEQCAAMDERPNNGKALVSQATEGRAPMQTDEEEYGELESLEGLTEMQTRGVVLWGLRREQVLKPTFGSHTSIGILFGMEQGKKYDEAVKQVDGLNAVQVEGITHHHLTRDQVLTMPAGFTRDGLFALFNMAQSGMELNAAFNAVKGLTDIQHKGIKRGFTYEQVQTENFGEHTLNAVKTLYWRGEYLSPNDAFDQVKGKTAEQLGELGHDNPVPAGRFQEMVAAYRSVVPQEQGLAPIQYQGLLFGLTLEQVQTENFGKHTMNAINALCSENKHLTRGGAFEWVKGWTAEQLGELSRPQPLWQLLIENKRAAPSSQQGIGGV